MFNHLKEALLVIAMFCLVVSSSGLLGFWARDGDSPNKREKDMNTACSGIYLAAITYLLYGVVNGIEDLFEYFRNN